MREPISDLSLFAHAFLAAIRAAGLDILIPEKGVEEASESSRSSREGEAHVELTVAEFRRLCVGWSWEDDVRVGGSTLVVVMA